MTEHQSGWTPEACRAAIIERQGGYCARCWERCPADSLEAHHRLKRALMPAEFLWCPCNVVGLHARCHTQGRFAVHDHPEDAREQGLILWTNEDPRQVPIMVRWPWQAESALLCNGDVGSLFG